MSQERIKQAAWRDMCRAFDQLDSNTLSYSPTSPYDPDDVKDDLAYAEERCRRVAEWLGRLTPLLEVAPKNAPQRHLTTLMASVAASMLYVLSEHLQDDVDVLFEEMHDGDSDVDSQGSGDETERPFATRVAG